MSRTRSRCGGRARRWAARCAPWRSRATTRTSTYVDATCWLHPKVSAALDALVGRGRSAADRAPRQGADARAAARRPARCTTTPCSWRTSSIRARGSSCSTCSRSGSSRWRCSRPTRSPAPSISTAKLEIEQTGRRAAVVLQLAAALDHALEARELTDLYERFEQPLVRVLARMETNGIRIDREFLEVLRKDLAEQCDMYVQRIYAARGRGVQRELHPAAAHDPVRQARADAGEEDEDRSVDRCRLAAEARRRASDRRRPPAVPGGRSQKPG